MGPVPSEGSASLVLCSCEAIGSVFIPSRQTHSTGVDEHLYGMSLFVSSDGACSSAR